LFFFVFSLSGRPVFWGGFLVVEVSGPPEGARRGGGNRPPVALWVL